MLSHGVEPVDKPSIEIEVLGRLQLSRDIFGDAGMEDDGRDIVVLALDGQGREVSRFIVDADKASIPGIRLGNVVERPQAVCVKWRKFSHGDLAFWKT